jgi:predicted metal-dependent peptidase
VPIDYVTAHPDYDGLIILTDGEAPVPKVPALLRAKILWVIDNAENFYKRHYEDFRKTGRVCWMEL